MPGYKGGPCLVGGRNSQGALSFLAEEEKGEGTGAGLSGVILEGGSFPEVAGRRGVCSEKEERQGLAKKKRRTRAIWSSSGGVVSSSNKTKKMGERKREEDF